MHISSVLFVLFWVKGVSTVTVPTTVPIPVPTTEPITTTTETPVSTTLASSLKLVNWDTAYILAGSILVLIPASVLCACIACGCVKQAREKKVTDDTIYYDEENADNDDDDDFQHPAPAPPPPQRFRGSNIAGPFSNPVYDDEDDRRSGVVTPSFISTTVVGELSAKQPIRYQYIP